MIIIINKLGAVMAATICVLGALSGRAAAQTDAASVARRLATVASIALDEYGLGVVDGRVVAAAEVEEAELFLAEARRGAESLPREVRGDVLAQLDSLIAGVAGRQPVGRLRLGLDAMRRGLERAIGASLDPMPAAPPTLAVGQSLYRQSCRLCHGETGGGDGPGAQSLVPPPANLTERARLAGSSPLDFFRKINVGVAGTAMAGFEQQLSLEERWALAWYASSLRFTPAERTRGARLARSACPECLLLASDFHETASLSDDSLRARLAALGGPHPSDSAGVAGLAFARTAGAADELGGDRRLEAQRIVRRAKAGVASAVALAEQGNSRLATSQALEAYLVFERVETAVRARDAAAATRVERAFAGLRAAAAGSDPTALQAAGGEVEAALDAALVRHGAQASAVGLFGQSLVIMLREGLEAILIIGALMAFLIKAGARERSREIGYGVLAAIGASLATAVGFATLWSFSTAQREALEGFTMVVAAVVLFWVSYWLVSKIELRKWQAFVGAKMGQALSSRNALALAAVAFLAVYREGFETVLFYAALYASGDGVAGASAGITAGILLGFVALTVVYFAIQRFGVRIPLKPFFAVTSALLYVMAFSFAGQGVAELQEAGYIAATPLDWAPSVPFLGIFPTTQTLTIQLFLAVALFGALLWVFWLEPRVVSGKAVRP